MTYGYYVWIIVFFMMCGIWSAIIVSFPKDKVFTNVIPVIDITDYNSTYMSLFKIKISSCICVYLSICLSIYLCLYIYTYIYGWFAIKCPKPWFDSLRFIEIYHIQNNSSQLLYDKGIYPANIEICSPSNSLMDIWELKAKMRCVHYGFSETP